jgi:hypothetical protein
LFVSQDVANNAAGSVEASLPVGAVELSVRVDANERAAKLEGAGEELAEEGHVVVVKLGVVVVVVVW